MGDSRWYISVDGQQLDGDYSLESAKELVQKNLGKRVLVWTQGMPQWAIPEDLPQFKMPIPRPAASAPAPVPAPAPAPAPAPEPVSAVKQSPKVTLDAGQMKEKVGFLKVLLDFRFENFVTSRMIPVLYAVVTVLIGLAAVGYILVGGGGMILTGIRFKVMFSIFAGLLIIVLTPVVAVLYLALIRMWFEIVLILFRIKDDLGTLVERSKSKNEK